MFWNSILEKILFKLVFGGVCTLYPSKNIQGKLSVTIFSHFFLLTLIFLQEKKKRQDIKARDKRTHYA